MNDPGGPLHAAELLKDDFGWALGVILRTYLRAAEAAVSDIPGGSRGYQVIASAAQELATNQGVLATQLGIDRTVLTYLIDDLETAGLVTRQPDPTDRRTRRIVATDRGHALWQARRDTLSQAEAHVLAGLGDDMCAFRNLLQRAAVHADQLDPCVFSCQEITELG